MPRISGAQRGEGVQAVVFALQVLLEHPEQGSGISGFEKHIFFEEQIVEPAMFILVP